MQPSSKASTFVGDGRQEALGEHSHLLGVGLASLDELDEARTHSTREFDMRGDLRRRSLIRPAGDGADRADNPHPIGVGDGKNSTKSRLDHADHGHIETGLKLIESNGRRRVAGHHDDLGIVGFHHPLGDLWAKRRTSS